MGQKSRKRSSLAPRGRTAERVLVSPGSNKLSLKALEERCLAPLTRLIAENGIWRREDYGTGWKVGDYNIVIVETTVAPDALLYVQFWFEPEQPADWEVSSGNLDRPARRFITPRVRRRIEAMGFKIGGRARNFRRTVSIADEGDAEAVARDVLRIFHDAFGYRGATPLVLRLMSDERATRGVVHTRFTPEDVLTILHSQGYAAEQKRRGKRPLILASRETLRFAVGLDVLSPDGRFHCLDIMTIVGTVTEATRAAWMAQLNALNAQSRVARGWVDSDGDVAVGTNIMCREGVTEAYIVERLSGWHRAALLLADGSHVGQDGAPDDDAESDPEDGGAEGENQRPRSRGEVVH